MRHSFLFRLRRPQCNSLGTEAGIPSETLQMFLARHAGVAEGRLSRKGERDLRAALCKTVLVVDEGSLGSTVQARDLLRIANALRIPRVVLVGDEKQLDAVDAGKPFAQPQRAGMKTAVMDEILRQRDSELKAAVEASVAGEIGKAFEKLGASVAEVKADNIAGAVAARWLKLSPEERENTGHGAKPRAAEGDQRPHPRAARPRWTDPWSHIRVQTAGLARHHHRREGAHLQLCARRRRRVPPPPTRRLASGRAMSGESSASIASTVR